MALPHAKSGEPIDLGPLGPALATTKTTALVKSDRFEVVRLIVPAGTTIPTHQVPGYITLHCLEGRVTLGPSGPALGAGEWLYLDRGEPHSVSGVKDSSLLLTIFFDS